ncbi:aromatic amino acid transport family protein [Methanocaldococcus sp.]
MSLYKAISILVGTIIGAGVLGLPYVVAKVGFPLGALTILFSYIILLTLGCMLVELSIKYPKHQLVEISKKSFGKYGEILMLFFTLFSILSALSAYYVGFSDTIGKIFPNIKNLGAYILLMILIFINIFGLKAADELELILTIIMLALILLITFLLLPHISLSNVLYINPSFKSILAVFSVAIFAIYGHMVIPEVVEEVNYNKKLGSLAVILGLLIPTIIYIFFSFSILGITRNPAQVATLVLDKISPTMNYIGIGFSALAILSSAIGNVLVLRDIIVEDLNKPIIVSIVLTILPLFIIYFSYGFSEILNIAGTYGIGGSSILIALSYYKKGKNRILKYLSIIIALIFILVAIFNTI